MPSLQEYHYEDDQIFYDSLIENNKNNNYVIDDNNYNKNIKYKERGNKIISDNS